MSSQSPAVTVYMPTRNRAHLVGRAAASVLAQDFRDLELLIVDDASTDDTPRVLAEIAARDTRVRLLRMDRASGAPAARNEALRHAQGRFVTGIDDDDEMLPSRIMLLLRAFDDRYVFVCSGAYIDFGGWRKPVRTSRLEITLERELSCDEVGTQVLTLTERMQEIGMYDEQMPATQDYDMWTRLLMRRGLALRIAEPTYVVHVDPTMARVSNQAVLGAQRYLAKHGAVMTPQQRKKHRLRVFMLERRRMTLGAALNFVTSETWSDIVRYGVTSNVPQLRLMADRYRRWRWARRAPADAKDD